MLRLGMSWAVGALLLEYVGCGVDGWQDDCNSCSSSSDGI